jgi:PAS domain S-box-containing protein
MNLHPGPENSRVLEGWLAELDPIRRGLQENEDWYRDLVEHSHDLLCVHDLEGRLLSINPAPARLLGYSVDEMLQIPLRELVAPEFRNDLAAYFQEIERAGEARGLLRVMTRSGERRIWEYRNSLRTKGVASPIVRGMAHDVTDQKRAEKLLQQANANLTRKVRESERTIRELKLFRTLVDRSNDAIEVVDPETLHFVDANETACSRLGYSKEELLSLGVLDIDPAVGTPASAKILERLNELGCIEMESIHRRKDGSTFPVELSLTKVHLDRDYVVSIARDISKRKIAEVRLKASESCYRAVHDLAPVGICRVETRTGRFLGVNPKYCEILGRTEQDLLTHDFQSLTHPDDLAGNLEKLRQLADGEVRHYEMEKRYLCPDGSIRWVEVDVAAMWPEGEDPTWHMAIVHDVTGRRHSEDRLREYEKVVEGLEEMITVVDRDYRYAIANRAYLNYRGLKKEQVVGRRLDEMLNPEDFAVVKPKLDECFAGSTVRYEMRCTYPQIGERDLWVSYFPIESGWEVKRIACILQDITERNRAQEALLESERTLKLIIDHLPVGVLLTTTDSQHTLYQNPRFVELFGYSIEHFPTVKEWWPLAYPDAAYREQLAHNWQGRRAEAVAAKGEIEPNDVTITCRDGSEKYVRVLGKIIGDRSFVTFVDLSERKRAEEALRLSEENYRMFVSQSSEGIFREEMDAPVPIDLPEDELIHHILQDSYLGECSDAMAAMYGFKSGDELRGKRLVEMVPPDDPHNIELTRKYIRSGFRLLEHESHEVDIHGNAKVFLNSMIGTVENGMLVRTWGIQRDVTEKVKLEQSRSLAEEALQRNVARLEQVTEELRVAQEKLSEEKLYLEESIDTELGFGEIIGCSNALKDVMQKVAKVAPSDATVLLLGETGTGKELVARALHRLSKRQGNSFIKMNCAAIPSGLLESELFGHEKGAFTGAVTKKLGRLELADQGTIFLDEVGDIPLNLQPKLLRVLQDMEFERLGGTQTLKVNFRLLAATNRDLLQSVKAREFRSDLYYRLNVFPIVVPPLRERREDIRPLIEHFVRKFSSQMKKSITSIPSKTMEILVRWEWPGNIRELENFMERSVILTPGSVLQAPLSELEAAMEEAKGNGGGLGEKQVEHIHRALRECNGKLGGPNGAAARLGLKRTTLQSKLDHLGIKPGIYRR